MSAVAVDIFLTHLSRSNLLAPEQIEEVRGEVERAAGGLPSEGVARRLVKRGWLTPWQARMLLAGRHAFFLGRYKLLDQIGQGGMGAVFKAQHAALGRIVAVKMMAKNLTKDAGAVARFHREIQAAAALNHPHIVIAYDADFAHGTHFLVMEYVDGEDLDAIVKRRGPLPIAEACEYIRHAALGLQHAHERGMVHRDIKPSNLLLATDAETKAPVVKILDMGLARLASETVEAGHLTHTGQVLGTPDYISPEQARDTKSADIRSDIYSLGCALFRLLTGKVPFTGANVMEKLMARALGDAPPVTSLRADVPAALEAVLRKMMVREPVQRYQSPGEVAAALAPFCTASEGARAAKPQAAAAAPTLAPASGGTATLEQSDRDLGANIDTGLDQFLQNLATEAEDDEAEEDALPAISAETKHGSRSGKTEVTLLPTAAGKEPAINRPRGPTKRQAELERRRLQERKRNLLIAGGAGAILLIAAVAFVWQKLGETTLIVDWPDADRKGAKLEIDGRDVSIPAQGTLEFTADPGKRSVRLSKKGFHPIAREWTLARGQTETFRPEWKATLETVRKQDAAALQKEVADALAAFKASPPRAGDPKVKSLRDRVNAFRLKQSATAEGLHAAVLLGQLPAPADALRREDIPQAELVAAGHGNADDAPSELVAIFGDSLLKHWFATGPVAFSPNGELLACGLGNNSIDLLDAATGRKMRTLRGHGNAPSSLVFSPDGRTLYSAATDGHIGVWDVQSGRERHMLPVLENGQNQAIALSRDGKWLAATVPENRVRIWDVSGEDPADRATLSGFTDRTVTVAISPDGELLAAGSMDKTIRLWDLDGDTPTERAVLTKHDVPITFVAFAPDGKSLASAAGGVVLVWDVSGTEPAVRQTLDAHENLVVSLVWSPDGRTLLSGMQHGVVKVWEVTGKAKERTTLRGQPASLHTLAVTADFQKLALSSSDGVIRILDPITGKDVLKTSPVHASAAVSPDGTLLAAGMQNGDITFRELAGGDELPPISAAHSNWVNVLAFNPDGTILASIGQDGSGKLWDVAKRRELRLLSTEPVFSLAFSPDGKTLAAPSSTGAVRLWDLDSGSERPMWQSFMVACHSVAISPDGKQLAAGSAYTGEAGEIKLWDFVKGRELRKLSTHAGIVYVLAYSPDGGTLASGSQDGTVKLWNLATGKERAALFHSGEVMSLAFSTDGTLLATAATDGTLRLWQTRDGTEKKSWQIAPPTGRVLQVAFTPDGRHLVTGNGNGTMYVLRLRAWSTDPAPSRPR